MNLNMYMCLLPLTRTQSTSDQPQVRVFDSICILDNWKRMLSYKSYFMNQTTISSSLKLPASSQI